MVARPWVIGLTGPFGSGCSLAGKYLEHERGFKLIKLSDPLKAIWAKQNSDSGKPPRSDLQALGDQLRKDKGGHVLAELASEGIDPEVRRMVVDGIRNVAEVEWLRSEYGYRFTLVAILAPPEVRWDRIGATTYNDQGLTKKEFAEDDRRDSKEDVSYGQQVALCIDNADILIDNSALTTGEFKSN